MPAKRISRTTAKKLKKSSGSSGVPLFINLDESQEKLTAFINRVMNGSGLIFHDREKQVRKITQKVNELGLKTLSTQVISGLLAEEAAQTHLTTTPDGWPIPEFGPNARIVLERRYLIKNDHGDPIEQPWEMLQRVARTIAKIDAKFDPQADTEELARQFYEVMAHLEFLPNSPTLMNAGRELGQLSACFVLPVGDSMDSIFEAIKHTALIHKSGGGTGFSFSKIRPKNDPVASTKGISSGPISFMTVFDAATDTIKQGGTRRGANMGILRVDHPDILEFITAKQNLEKLNNFNLSVAVTGRFMEAVKQNQEYDLINPRTNRPQGKLNARRAFEILVQQAWATGEPGLVFLDRINQHNPTPGVGEIEATNPCGEQPLLPYESCNLGSINLSRVVDGRKVDWEKLRRLVHLGVHFLDNVIEANRFPIAQIEEQTIANRKIGLGVMGFAELLIKLGIPYDTQRGLDKGRKIMAFIQAEALAVSCALADQRGPFPNIERSIYRNLPDGKRPRNATVTTIAPTGTLSILAGTTSGIEPIFALSFFRKVLDGDELVEVNPLFEAEARAGGFYSEPLMHKIAQAGSVRHLNEVPAAVRKLFATAHDIAPAWHVRMQAAFQEFTDNAVSKTVNFPEEATPQQVAETFLLAYESGCKGVTIFRYGSRDPVLNLTGADRTKATTKTRPNLPVLYDQLHPRRRPSKLSGSTELMTIGCGKLYITVNRDEIGLCEVFTSTGRTGGCPSQSEAISRMVSLALRSGVALDEIIHQLQGIRCHSAIRRNDLVRGDKRAVSCPAAIGLVLAAVSKSLTPEADPAVAAVLAAPTPINGILDVFRNETSSLAQGKCPECNSKIEYESGCVVCRTCGYSKCG